MRSPNKSRSRNKNNNRRPNTLGNVINRVFDSNGPQGRVRGTPNQIIEKYQSLAQDSMLGGDRVEAENFSQHAEHYIRLLSEAQAEMAKEQEARQAEQDARQAEQETRQSEHEARQPRQHFNETVLPVDQDSSNETNDQDLSLIPNDQREEQPRSRRAHSPRPQKRKFENAPEGNEKHSELQGFDADNAPDFLKVIND